MTKPEPVTCPCTRCNNGTPQPLYFGDGPIPTDHTPDGLNHGIEGPGIIEPLRPLALPIGDLVEWDQNPRHGDDYAVMGSVRQFGAIFPGAYRDEDGHRKIFAGNTRWRAMTALDWEYYPAVDAAHLNADQIRAFALADNHTSERGTYDHQQLLDVIRQVEAADAALIEAAGYDPDDIADLLDTINNPDGNGEDDNSLGGDDNYSRKIEAPIYEPTGPKPPVTDLYDTTRRDQLQAEINTTPDLPDDIRTFLLSAAERHTVFRFDRIAEFYAHSPTDTQQLMENSTLVIIDFDRAIELGFVTMTEQLIEQFGLDHPDSDPAPANQA